jgi:hypothetical protein
MTSVDVPLRRSQPASPTIPNTVGRNPANRAFSERKNGLAQSPAAVRQKFLGGGSKYPFSSAGLR